MNSIFENISNFFTKNVLLTKIIGIVLIIIIGVIAIKILLSVLQKIMERRNFEKSLILFLTRFCRIVLYLLLLFMILEKIGVSTASIIAVIGTAGVAIGLALKDSLSNFAGGVLILVNKTFSIGDYVKFGPDEGVVHDFDLLYTTLKTPDAKLITIPNGLLSNSSVYNYSKAEFRRVELLFKVSYKNDINKTKSVIENVLKLSPKVVDNCSDGNNIIRVNNNGSNGYDVDVKAWCKSSDYWDVFYDLNEQIKQEFDTNNIEIPYDKLDVCVIKKD